MRTFAAALLVTPLLSAAMAPWPTDSWATSTPEQQGMDSALLQTGDAFIRSQCPTRYSFLVIRNGYLVWESYYHRMTQNKYVPASRPGSPACIRSTCAFPTTRPPATCQSCFPTAGARPPPPG